MTNHSHTADSRGILVVATETVSAVDDRAGPATHDAPATEARELAQRRSGDVDVFLLWHAEGDRAELCLLDLVTGVSVHIDVAAERALDAFHHPYAYVGPRGA